MTTNGHSGDLAASRIEVEPTERRRSHRICPGSTEDLYAA